MDRRQLLYSLASGGSLLTFGSVAKASANHHLVSANDPRLRQDYLDTEAGQLYYWTAGSGPNLVLVHQSGNSSEEFAGLVPLLADRCRLIAVDLPGHGRSDDPRTEPTVDDYTLAVERVLQHLNVEKAHLLGHHGGSLAAMNLAARTPGCFDKIILSGTGGVRTPEENQAFVDSLLKIDTTIRSESDFVAKAWDRYVAMMSDGGNVADIMKPFIAFLDARLRPYRGVVVNLKWDRRPALSKLRGPVLLVQGEKDEYVSGQASLLKVIPNSTRIEMPGCGTFMFFDKPKACAAMIADYLEL